MFHSVVTINCIVCGKPKKFSAGHVIEHPQQDVNDAIVAGFCSDSCYEKVKGMNFLGHIGCFGYWAFFMGSEFEMK